MRSKPGEGKQIGIYALDIIGEGDSFMESCSRLENETAIWACVGEDYANCSFPVVVKTQAWATREQVIQCLNDLVSAISKGSLIEVPKEGSMHKYMHSDMDEEEFFKV